MTKNYFFDSYAIYELIIGNKDYENYIDANIVITKLNIFEVFYILMRDGNKELANNFITSWINFVVDFEEDVIKEAAMLRLINKKYNLSMTDCIGYIIAKKLSIKFLTGDRQFENMDNVEFVK